ncbi:MAG: heavy metal translocating P-type ATPase, partial [Anaerolineaceae bacterium]|nr:heavy metal translocating P-type ATPase [Anaerolineaceae bacterium]
MSEKEHVNLPVLGMTCANCAVSVERALKKTEGVDDAMVNLSSERVAVTFDGDQAALNDLVTSIKDAGYDVATGEAVISIPELSDAVNVQRLEKLLQDKLGVVSARANQVAETLSLVYVPTVTNVTEIMEVITKAGFSPVLSDRDLDDPETKARQNAIARQRHLLTVSLILTVPIFILQMGTELGLLPQAWMHQPWFNWLLFALATPVQFYVGRSYYVNAYKSLKNGSANMDVLVALGTSVAYFFSILVILGVFPGMVYFETSATIITLVRLGKYLETKAKSGAGDSIKKLLSLKPSKARILRDGQEVEIDAGDLVPGDMIVVKPGEKLPTDGIVVEGNSSLDESMLTGESKPIDKNPGDEVFGATLNKNGRLVYKATKVGRDTFLSQIIKMVEDAQTSKAPIQQLADKISAVFVPIVIGIALVTFLVWFFVQPTAPQNIMMHGAEEPTRLARALINTVAVLVIACPCAMGLATPTAVMTGTGRASELGILFKSGESLE